MTTDVCSQGLPQNTGFCEAVRNWLPTLRKSAQSFPVVSWDGFVDAVRAQVNPLASHEHFTELLSQLQHMGEVTTLDNISHFSLFFTQHLMALKIVVDYCYLKCSTCPTSVEI